MSWFLNSSHGALIDHPALQFSKASKGPACMHCQFWESIHIHDSCQIVSDCKMSDLAANQCFAHVQLCVCDRCVEEVQLINMAQWEFAEWESGISWCRRCFQMCGQFKTERNTGPRVPDKKKQTHVNASVQKIGAQHPVSWSECMTCIDAEFPDPTETCKFLQSDAKRVPKTSGGKHCELVAICNADAAILKSQPVSPSLGPPKGAIAVGSARTSNDGGRTSQAGTSSGQTHEATGTVQPPDGHVFAENLQAICQGEPVPPTAVAVMRTNDGRNSCSKKQPYLAFLLPERGRYVWMRSWEAWGLRKCSLCEYPRTYRFFRLNTINYYGNDACARFKSQCDCCEPLYMRFHIKEKKHQDEIKRLVQSKDIDRMFKGKRHDVHFKMEEDEENYRQGVQSGSIKPGLGPFGMYQKPKGAAAAAAADLAQVTGKRTRPSKADDSGLKMCQFCDRRKRLRRFPMRLIMTCKGHAERKLGAHCKKCMIRSAHLRSNGYMRPHAQDLLKAYHSAKGKSARFSGNDSDSEDYEVDDNGMVEKQMRELGVDVIMHHTMVEDLAIQQAATGTSSQHEARTHLPPLAQGLPTGSVKMGSRGASLNLSMGGAAELHAGKDGARFGAGLGTSEQLQQALRTPLSATLQDEAGAMAAGGLVGAVKHLGNIHGVGANEGDAADCNPRKLQRSGRLGSDTEDEWQHPGSVAAMHKARSVGGSVELPHDAIAVAAGMRAGSTELPSPGSVVRVPKLEADEMEAMPGHPGLTVQQSEQLVQQMLTQGRAPSLNVAFPVHTQSVPVSSQLGTRVPSMHAQLPDSLAAQRLLAGAAGMGTDAALQNSAALDSGLQTVLNGGSMNAVESSPAVPNAFGHEPAAQANIDKVLMDLTAQHEHSVLQLSALHQLQQEASQAPPSVAAPFASLTQRQSIAHELSALQRGAGTQIQSAVEQQQQQQLALQCQLHQLQTQQQLQQLTTELADATADTQAATPRGQEHAEDKPLGADDLPLTWACKRHRTSRMPSNGAPDPLAVLTGQQQEQEPVASSAQGQAAALASMYQQQLRPLLNPQLELAVLSGGFQGLQQSQAADSLAALQSVHGVGAANGLQGLLGAAVSAPAMGGVSGALSGLGDLAGMSRLASVSQLPQLNASNMAQPLAGLDLVGLGQGLPNRSTVPQLGMQQASQVQTGTPFSAHSVAQQVQQLPQQSVFGPRAGQALQEQVVPRSNTANQTSDPVNSLALLHSLATNGSWK